MGRNMEAETFREDQGTFEGETPQGSVADRSVALFARAVDLRASLDRLELEYLGENVQGAGAQRCLSGGGAPRAGAKQIWRHLWRAGSTWEQ